ncbi:hypothetical protein DVH24_026687 [Malus domestica]|uniref:Uncharacterized protein n=1 Tax=Malus domestica TaxID=3750 RepID=A0A498K4D0_MALDO|nr:hypothetical protein DVH24_026687 [Malus domestica]
MRILWSWGNKASTSTTDLDTTGVPPVTPLGPTVSTVADSSTSSVTHHVLSTRQTHRWPQTSEEAQHSGNASSVHGEASQIGFGKCYSFRGGSTEFSVENRNCLMYKKNHVPLQTTKDFSDHSHHDPEDHHISKTFKIVLTTHPRDSSNIPKFSAATKKQHSALAIDVDCVIRSHCRLKWGSWRVVPQETKDTVLYELLGKSKKKYDLDR